MIDVSQTSLVNPPLPGSLTPRPPPVPGLGWTSSLLFARALRSDRQTTPIDPSLSPPDAQASMSCPDRCWMGSSATAGDYDSGRDGGPTSVTEATVSLDETRSVASDTPSTSDTASDDVTSPVASVGSAKRKAPGGDGDCDDGRASSTIPKFDPVFLGPCASPEPESSTPSADKRDRAVGR